MKQVRMKKAHLNLMAGEVAGFEPATADDLIARGIAVLEADHQAALEDRRAAEQAAMAAAEDAAAEAAEAERLAAEQAAKAMPEKGTGKK